MSDALQTDFGVTHGGRWITVDRSEVTLSIHKGVTHGKILCQAHDGVIYGSITMGMVFTNHVTDDTRRLLIWLIPVIFQFTHGIQNAPVNRFQAISNVG